MPVGTPAVPIPFPVAAPPFSQPFVESLDLFGSHDLSDSLSLSSANPIKGGARLLEKRVVLELSVLQDFPQPDGLFFRQAVAIGYALFDVFHHPLLHAEWIQSRPLKAKGGLIQKQTVRRVTDEYSEGKYHGEDQAGL